MHPVAVKSFQWYTHVQCVTTFLAYAEWHRMLVKFWPQKSHTVQGELCNFCGIHTSNGRTATLLKGGDHQILKLSIGKHANRPLQNRCFLPKPNGQYLYLETQVTFHGRLQVKLLKSTHIKSAFPFCFKDMAMQTAPRCFDPAYRPLNHVWPGPEVVCLHYTQIWISIF